MESSDQRRGAQLEIYDTTLRDGTQMEGISLSCDDKLRIARKLDQVGVAFIEGGWPGSNPKDAEFFDRAKGLEWRQARIAAFGATRRAGLDVEQDENLAALLDAGTQVCTVVGKSWTMHVTGVLRTDLEENLRMIEESLAYLQSQGRQVIFDAEHFFDGYKADPEYACAVLAAAADAGVETLVLCDTNGGSLPWEVEKIVSEVAGRFSVPLGIHTHDDGGCAVANTVAAVRAGASHIQGTINGYGERCGNANLCSVIPDLELKMGYGCLPEGKVRELYEVAHFVAEVANLAPDEHMPFVGRSAFAHKGGIHVAAMRRTPLSYQHIDPEAVGNQSRVVVSELSGRGNLLSKAEELKMAVSAEADVSNVVSEIKELEARGFSFEVADASVALLLHRQSPDYVAPFDLIDYAVTVEHRQGRGTFAEATVKVRVQGEVMHTAAEGNGPVNALDAALRKALTPVYPQLGAFQLVDYKVRILDGENGTGATTRVLIDSRNGRHRWTTVGASTNIIEASWRALADGIEYGLRSTT